ncbi:MAG: hypothetical protein A2Y77_05735 [Planctomycetes bacterium RBG_13_62_9]|nr:MAG: hypothetical protein A2Y77_05735 [Planctomycetes bacterium RBG_13_62_9]
MKSDHRHELKTNELADWMAHLPEWVHQNRNSIIGVAALCLVAFAVYFWSFYRRNVVVVRNRTQLTNLLTQVPQQMSNIARAGTDQSYVLLPIANDLDEFAQTTSNDDMAALALIQRAVALRAELHYRLADVPREELTKRIAEAQASYQQALDRKPSNPALAAAAHFGLGLCEEEVGNFDKAAEVYRTVAQKPEYAGTAAQEAAAFRLKIMGDYETNLVFKPAPPKPAQATVPTVQIKPADANAPAVVRVPSDANAGPVVGPSIAPDANKAPSPANPPTTTDTNAPKNN